MNDGEFGENVILDIKPLCIDTSLVKQPTPAKETTLVKLTSSGIGTFIGVRPKISKYTKSTAFKQPESVKKTTYKPIISDLVSYVIVIIVLYLVSLTCQLC